MFTPDAVLYFIPIANFAATYVLVISGVVYRHDIAQLFNSYMVFSESYARKLKLAVSSLKDIT